SQAKCSASRGQASQVRRKGDSGIAAGCRETICGTVCSAGSMLMVIGAASPVWPPPVVVAPDHATHRP
ncbi:MAG: hypothetical protein ACNA8P_09445, partial [Phycisphaerales bacterium]